MRLKFLSVAAAVASIVLATATAQGPPHRPVGAAFEVFSVKDAGTGGDHMHATKPGDYALIFKPLEYKGNRLTCDAPLDSIIKFAFAELVVPYRDQMPISARQRYYRIEAIAPEGSSISAVGTMLRAALGERLGLRYHVEEQTTEVFDLIVGTGKLKLVPSPGSDPPGMTRSQWRFVTKSASVADLARFLSGGMRREIVDKTAIGGKYQFNIDWTDEVAKVGVDGIGPGLVTEETKRLGLRLVPGKETRKILVIDHVNEKPTPN